MKSEHLDLLLFKYLFSFIYIEYQGKQNKMLNATRNKMTEFI